MMRFIHGNRAKPTLEYMTRTEPLAGKRITKVTERRTRIDWAHFIHQVAQRYANADKITLVMDNLNTHSPGALYLAFAPAQAKALWDRFEFAYTPICWHTCPHGQRSKNNQAVDQ